MSEDMILVLFCPAPSIKKESIPRASSDP